MRGLERRSPLGALSACVHLLSHGVGGKPNDRALRNARQSTTSISGIITDLSSTRALGSIRAAYPCKLEADIASP